MLRPRDSSLYLQRDHTPILRAHQQPGAVLQHQRLKRRHARAHRLTADDLALESSVSESTARKYFPFTQNRSRAQSTPLYAGAFVRVKATSPKSSAHFSATS